MNQTQYIDELNKIRGLEMRMSLVYHRLSQVIVGPWRDSLAAAFEEHAAHETEHAALTMRRIVSLGGKVGVDVPEIPDWATLSEMLEGLEKLEREGVDRWNDLLEKLDSRDPFRNVVEDILIDETEHLDEAVRWRSGMTEVTKQDEAEAVGEDIEPQNAQAADDGQQGQESTEEQPDDAEINPQPEDQEVDPSEALSPVGDTRTLQVYGTGVNYLDDGESIADAWQQEDGSLTGTGMLFGMLFEPFSALMHRDSSIGLDVSPLEVLRMRLAHSPFLRVAWEDSDD